MFSSCLQKIILTPWKHHFYEGSDGKKFQIWFHEKFQNGGKIAKLTHCAKQKVLKTLPFSKISIKPVKNQQSCVKIEDFNVQEKNLW